MRVVFDDIEDFYDDNPVRRYSPECDYGVHWRTGDSDKWRVTYVRDTGEIYAIHLRHHSTVLILGWVKADHPSRFERYYDTLDHILRGWGNQCLDNDRGLFWIQDRFAGHGVWMPLVSWDILRSGREMFCI